MQDNAADYVPDVHGYVVVLPDGTDSRVRFHKYAADPTGFIPEWRVANRDFPNPEKYSLKAAVERVCTYFVKPQTKIPFTEDALKLHQSYQGSFNVKCALARESGDIQQATT